MKISELIKNGQQVQVVINALDLKEAFLEWEKEREIEREKEKREEVFLSRDEAAKMLRKDKSTLYRWEKSGDIKACRIGREVKYKQSEIMRFLGQ